MSRHFVEGDVLHAGTAQAPVLALDEPLSFWGGFDPATGRIVDKHHPQAGECLTGKILVLTQTRGSAATPGGLAEAVRRGTAPAAIVLGEPDVNVAVGAMIASALYDTDLPVVAVCAGALDQLNRAEQLHVAIDGTVSIIDSSA